MDRFRKQNIAVIAAACVVFVIVLFVFPSFFRESISEKQQKSALKSEITFISAKISDSYLWPTDTEYITDSDLDQFTKEEIILIRNELYARHGYNFRNETIRAYFEARDWYHPIPGVDVSTFDASWFNEYETANLATIIAYEKRGDYKSEIPSDTGSREEDVVEDHPVSEDDTKRNAPEMPEHENIMIAELGEKGYEWLIGGGKIKIAGILLFGLAGLVVLRSLSHKKKRPVKSPPPDVPPKGSNPGPSGGNFTMEPFNGFEYVRANCPSYLRGVPSKEDIQRIENDSRLTSSQKEEAKEKLNLLSTYYQ